MRRAESLRSRLWSRFLLADAGSPTVAVSGRRIGGRRVAASLLIGVLLVSGVLPGNGRSAAQSPAGYVDVFVDQDPATGAATIYFLDALSGLSTVVNATNGEHFTLLADHVIYQKRQTGAIMRANLNGTLEPHPFVRRSVDTQIVRWVVSPDRRAIAWVTVSRAGESAAFAAWADGRDLRQLPIPSPGPEAILTPLALADNLTRFVYDARHPADDATIPFALYADLAEYSFVEGQINKLPGEPNCLCGAAMDSSGRLFARLEANRGLGPFALHLWDLPTRAETRIAAPEVPYHFAGDLILNATGTFAAYTVAAGVGSEALIRPAEYGLMLVNVVAAQQYLVRPPGPVRFRPVAFVDGDSALLLIEAETGATYKLILVERRLQKVSDRLYLGTIIVE